MKHAHVDETLTTGERLAPFVEPVAPWARLAEPVSEPLPRPSRTVLEWDGADWMEWNPATGEIIATGTVDVGNQRQGGADADAHR